MSSQRVLVIEDNEGDMDLIRLGLTENGCEQTAFFEVFSADRLSSGLAAMSKERPAVVLLDLYLPDSQGAETFKSLINQAAGVPVVVLSARDDEDLVVNAAQHGVQDYLVKGAFNGKHLGRTLRCAIERQALLTALGMSRKGPLQSEAQVLSPVWNEVHTSLTSIHQGVTTVLDDLAAPVSEGQRQHLDAALRSVNQLRSVIDDKLDV
jgi:DNA-binding response OmpR family regulator